jgi:hypothetical protein
MSFEDDDYEEFSTIYKILTEPKPKRQQTLIVEEIKTKNKKVTKQLKLSSFEECNEKYVEVSEMKINKSYGK